MSSFRFLRLQRGLSKAATLAVLGVGPAALAACSSHSSGAGTPAGRITGQTAFQSAPQLGGSGSTGSPGFAQSAGGGAAGTAPVAAPTNGANTTSSSQSTSTRTVSETDLYAVEGNRLYYLNSYRGLMVFDITNPDAPALIGRAPIFGDPQEMTVQNGICVAVVGDWYGRDSSGLPFHGSIARGFDATDPTNIKVIGDAQLGGYVQDTRVVGNVLYAVIEDYGWEYGWYGGWGGYYGGGIATPVGSGGVGVVGDSSDQPAVAIASVSFANGVVSPVGYQKFPGTGGVFNVTPNAIMVATDVTPQSTESNPDPQGQTSLQYVDISDPGGAIKLRGSITVNGAVTGWGPDNGRWNLDFADGVHAHALGCGDAYCGDATDSYLLSTVDFTNPDAPVLDSNVGVPNLGWSVAALFNGNSLYLSPADDYYGSDGNTPFSVYDLTNPEAPKLAGSTSIDGNVWLYRPDGTNLFSIGQSANNGPQGAVEVQYLNVSNAASPQVMGSQTFGNGWAWTPAASTFKAITIDDTRGLMVVPFSGWDSNSYQYTNGVQILGYSATALTTSATAFSKGWVQRGIFVNNRLFSISDEALAVVDYSNPASPQVTGQLTLARNVINAQPQGSTIAELSSDWWGNDVTTSEMRVLPIANATETSDNGTGVSVNINGIGAQVFQNGTLAYVVTDVQHPVSCNQWGGDPSGTGCTGWSEQVQVVDTSNGGAKLLGQLTLPDTPDGWGGWGWGGFWYYDWFDGSEIVQVGSNALAFRRWYPQFAPTGADGSYQYVDSLDALYVVDLSNPNAPSLASMTVTADPTAWWGDVQAIGNELYTTHYEWVEKPDPSAPEGTLWYVRYYLDQVDLTDRAHPKFGHKYNVPGQLVGASSEDPTVIYTIDYRWDSNGNPRNDLDVVKLDGNLAYLQSVTQLDGWVGNVIVQNDIAYASVQEYDWMLTQNGGTYTQPYVELHQVNLTNPQKPVDYVGTNQKDGWGWLLAVQGDRAVVTSGWGPMGFDIYKLSPSSAPVFDQSVRTLGWGGANSIIRQDNTLYVTSGYWGVQTIDLTQ
jgi:hypothetical protein